MPTALRLTTISKRFGPLVANDAISFELATGEVLALLGENGAGKSTLVSILFGHYVADSGSIEVHGRPLPPGQPRAALAAGIGMVHQHFTLADNLSVLDNVMLGAEPLTRWRSARTQARRALTEAAGRFGLQVDADARVADLSVGERQRVEILKALIAFGRKQGARILILDEPTAVLTPQESEALFATLQQMVAAGLSIVFISHKLDEVLRVANRIAVLRAGRLVALVPRAQADRERLAEAMVGRAVERPAKVAAMPGEPVLRLHEVGLRRRRSERPLLEGLNLELCRGEVLAIAGVAGNGQQALAALLAGEQAPTRGEITVEGRPIAARPQAWVRAGVARIPEDRQAVGAIGSLSLWENAVLERHAEPAFARGGLLRRGAARAFAAELIRRFDLRGTEAQGVDTPARMLSGGNLQKLILGRVLAARTPMLIVADQPTWGLDVGAVAYVHQQLLDACAAGAAVLLISEDLDEIFALADRIAVMHQGRLSESRPAASWSLTSIGLAMAGSAQAAA